ncbi:MAG: hypothetical protein ABGX07_08090 [Pirellulaceae bacterium]|nr:response regulator transcription factor [Planctomycetaceae bacterium]HIM28719.1 response regulator transcription factor [Planctomycetota bacterium]
MSDALKIQLAGTLSQSLRRGLNEMYVFHLVSATATEWNNGISQANLVLVDYDLWMATDDQRRKSIRNRAPAIVVILVTDLSGEEQALSRLSIDADDYLLSDASTAEIARTIRHARHHRSMALLLHDTQRKLAQAHKRSSQLMSVGPTYRIGVAGESQLVRPSRRETTVSDEVF